MCKLKFKILLFLAMFYSFVFLNELNGRVISNFNEKNIYSKDIKWVIVKTIHFDIYYPLGYKKLALLAAQYAENSSKYISNYFNYNLNKITEIYIFPSIDYKNKINLESEKSQNGYNQITREKVLVYFQGDYILFNTELTKKIINIYFKDIFFNDTTGKQLFYINENNVHAWVLNGLAEYIATGFNSYDDMVIHDLLNNDKKIFDINESYIWNNKVNSTLAKSFFLFYEKSFSKHKLIELLKDFRDLNDFKKALYINTGKEIDLLNKEWIDFYSKRYSVLDKNNYVKFEKFSKQILAPKLSVNGKKIAYFINENNKISVYIENLLTNEKLRIYEYNSRNRDISMHNFYNSVSWKNNNILLFGNKRNSIIIYNIKKKKILNEIKFPFTDIKYPAFSNDGKKIVFVGYRIFNNDIYSFSLKNNKLKRLTNNNFNELNPILSRNNRILIYSSNINRENNLHRDKYKVIIHDLSNNTYKFIGRKDCNNLHPRFDEKKKNIIFVSDEGGIYNSYIYNIKNRKYRRLSDVNYGVFYPDFIKGENSYYVINYCDKNSRLRKLSLKSDFPNKIYFKGKEVKISENKLTEDQLDLTQYSFQLDNLEYQLLLDASNKRDCSPELQISLTDRLNLHRFNGDIQGYIDNEHSYEINYALEYSYLRFPLNFTIASFREKTPFGYYALEEVSDYFYNCYSNKLNFYNIGFYTEFSYPIFKFVNVIFKTTLYRYEKNSNDLVYGEDISQKIMINRLAINFNDIVYGLNREFKGTDIKLGVNLFKGLTDEKYMAYNFDLKIAQYFHIFDYSLFKINIVGGYLKELENKNYYSYYLGGDNNLPAYEYGEFSGNKLGLVRTEFDLSVIQGINLGFLGNVNLRMALFSDLGSCWDKEFNLMNDENNEYEDLKIDVGSGFIIDSDQKIFFRFDCVWPYFYKRFGEEQYLFNIKIKF